MSANATEPNHTEHALLVLLGQYAQHLGLIQAHGCATAPEDLHPPSADQDSGVLGGDLGRSAALGRHQPGWPTIGSGSNGRHRLAASRLGRLQRCRAHPPDAHPGRSRGDSPGAATRSAGRSSIEQVTQALAAQGRLIYDGDLTGRPVSSTSTTYPDAAFGHMDDAVRLGYQAAVVSIGSPTYGRHWLAVKPHPGNLVSCRAGRRTGAGRRSQHRRAAPATD